MKKQIALFSFLIIGTLTKAQNTIPTTTVNGALEVKDSLTVTKDITAKSDVTIIGETTTKDTLRATEHVVAEKDIKVEGSIYTNKDVNVEGQTNSKGGFTFDGIKGLFYNPRTSTTDESFLLGSKTSTILPYYFCPSPQSEPWSNFYYKGNFVSYLPAGGSVDAPLVNSAIRIGIAPWNGNAVIDVSGVDAAGYGNNGLEINTFCKRNTYINFGWDLNPASYKDGGRVFMGAEVFMQRNLRIGNGTSNTYDAFTSLEINQNESNAKGVKVKTWNNSIKAFTVEWLDGKSPFTVLGNGQTFIGTKKPYAPHANAMLSVDGEIACKSLYVLKPTGWADFVFKKNDLETLSSVEKYITKNKHLPGLPSEEEILNNGYDINEMDAKLLEKIETLYLHIIKLEKEIEQLKNK